MKMVHITFLFLVIYQLKHFIADFLLQGKYMLGKFKPGLAWILPLTAHVAVHGAFTFAIAFVALLVSMPDGSEPVYSGVAEIAGILALFDMTIHFIMDRIKASPSMLGRYKAITATDYAALLMEPPQKLKVLVNGEKVQIALCSIQSEEVISTLKSNTIFWWSLGLDQMVHALTHYTVIYFLLRCL